MPSPPTTPLPKKTPVQRAALALLFVLVGASFWVLQNGRFGRRPVAPSSLRTDLAPEGWDVAAPSVSLGVRLPLSADPPAGLSAARAEVSTGPANPLPGPDAPARRLRFTALTLGDGPAAETFVAVDLGEPARSAPPRLWIDVNHDRDLSDEAPVVLEPAPDEPGAFRTRTSLLVPFALRAGGPPGEAAARLAFRLLAAADPPALHAASADRPSGLLALPGLPETSPRVLLLDRDANGLYEAHDLLLVDANGDGAWDVDAEGGELHAMSDAFLVAGRGWELAGWSPTGAWVETRATDRLGRR